VIPVCIDHAPLLAVYAYPSCSDSLPKNPPFTARLNNVKFEATEAIITDFFKQHGSKCTQVRIPKDDAGRVRGYAYCEFASVNDLKLALDASGKVCFFGIAAESVCKHD
jgi:RNA recognition motif-containing protein